MRRSPLLVIVLLLACACSEPTDSEPTDNESVRVVDVGDEEVTLDLSRTEALPGPCEGDEFGPGDRTARGSFEYGDDDRLVGFEYEFFDGEDSDIRRHTYSRMGDDIAAIHLSSSYADGSLCSEGNWTFEDGQSVREVVVTDCGDGSVEARYTEVFGPDALEPFAPLDCVRLLRMNGEQRILSWTRDDLDDGSIDRELTFTYDEEPAPGITRTRTYEQDSLYELIFFTYDDQVRLVERIHYSDWNDGERIVTTYAYEDDRLVHEAVDNGDPLGLEETVEYVYDLGGNLVGTIHEEESRPAESCPAESCPAVRRVMVYDYSCWP